MIKNIIFLVLSIAAFNANAHCPNSFKDEKACLMLDQNLIYIYDQKNEHNGPYMDLKENSLLNIKSDGNPVKYSRIANGVYKIEFSNIIKKVEIELLNSKTKLKKSIILNNQ